MRLHILLSLILLIVLATLAACTRKVAIQSRRGPRIVSTDPSATQILVEIGAGKTIVGVSPWDKPLLPKPMRHLPVVGGYLHLDEELVVRLAPTALIIQQSASRIAPGIISMARQNAIRVVNIRINTFHQLFATTRTLGKISGYQQQAAAAIGKLKLELHILAENKPHKPPRVVYMISTDPIMVVGADNFMDQEITLAGGTNVAERCGDGFPTITRETLVELNPQVLLISEPGGLAASGPNDPRLRTWLKLPIAAAARHRVDLITWPQAQMLTLRVGSLIRRLRAILQPTSPSGADK
jgi:iron complex transport system substrate-binding protein